MTTNINVGDTVKIVSHEYEDVYIQGDVETRIDMYGTLGKVTELQFLIDHPELAGTGRRYELAPDPASANVCWINIRVNGWEMTIIDPRDLEIV